MRAHAWGLFSSFKMQKQKNSPHRLERRNPLKPSNDDEPSQDIDRQFRLRKRSIVRADRIEEMRSERIIAGLGPPNSCSLTLFSLQSVDALLLCLTVSKVSLNSRQLLTGRQIGNSVKTPLPYGFLNKAADVLIWRPRDAGASEVIATRHPIEIGHIMTHGFELVEIGGRHAQAGRLALNVIVGGPDAAGGM